MTEVAMGIRHLITFLQPYADVKPLAGAQIVIDGPAFAYHIYFLCLKATPDTRNAFEAAPSYSVLVKTALLWLDGLQKVAVLKKIYFDGFLPARKFDTRLQRLIDQTRRLTEFHNQKSTPARSSYPRSEDEAPNIFDCSSVRSNLTSLPPLPFLVPAILEAVKQSGKYGAITEVVPAEADLWCAQYVKDNGGLILTGDSDLLVHDLGSNGCVSFLKDIIRVSEAPDGELGCHVFSPVAIMDRLELPKPYGLRSLGFEIIMDPHIKFRRLVNQAKESDAIKKYPKEYADFLEEYVLQPSLSDAVDVSAVKVFLQKLDPRISECVLQFPWFAQKSGSIHIFLPFLLDCPVHTNAWECSTPIRQLAYGFLNLIGEDVQYVQSVFEHRKQSDKSDGRELELPQISNISDACILILTQLSELRGSFPGLNERQIWIACAIHQHIEWSIANDKSSLVTIFMQQFLHIESLDQEYSFSWEAVQFFAELQASHYSFRILKQILDVVVAHGGTKSQFPSLISLYAQLQSVPDLTGFPTLVDASSAIRKVGDQEVMATVKKIVEVLIPLPATNTGKTSKKEKRKRKRERGPSEPGVGYKKPSNPFELLNTE